MFINFETLEKDIDNLKEKFLNANPFPHIVIDNFADEKKLSNILDYIPDPKTGAVRKSRDYIFAKNKFEKSNFKDLSPDFKEIHDEIISERFQKLLKDITGEDIFIDTGFHGGGIHQGGDGSFLDMHADFNYHPLHENWFRNLNILLYLNKDWKKEYKGQLKLRRPESKEHIEIEPLFNRCVIMFTRDYTLHGYDKINFPEGMYRRSIAAYAYTLDERTDKKVRSTVWEPENPDLLKKMIYKPWPTIVKLKQDLFGSNTAKNK